jgi:polar amino acid transport system substrate-binding protein
MPAGSLMHTIQDRGYLLAGASPDTLHFSSIDPATNGFSGFDIDILSEIARAIFGEDGHLRPRSVPVAGVIPRLQQGSVDIVAHTLTINCERRRQIDFSTQYYGAGQRVLVRIDSPVQGIQDLSGKRVCAAKASTSLTNIKKLNPKAVAVGDTENSDCLVDLQEGRVDAVSTDDTILAGMLAEDPYAKVVGARFSDEPYGLALSRQHPEFTRFVNGVLDRMRADGTWQAIYNRWLLSIAPTPAPPPALYGD